MRSIKAVPFFSNGRPYLVYFWIINETKVKVLQQPDVTETRERRCDQISSPGLAGIILADKDGQRVDIDSSFLYGPQVSDIGLHS
jgi:hypothetical protein